MIYENVSSHYLTITELNVWHEVFPPEEVLRMSYGCGGEGLHGDVISWKHLQTTMTGEFSFVKDPSCFFEKGI
jgi:hypothetical protein